MTVTPRMIEPRLQAPLPNRMEPLGADPRRKPRGPMQIRILVVDDEQDNCDYLKLVLEKEGYQVDFLTDPTQCIDALRKQDYHLIVLDMMMPQMSGAEVLQQIRKVDSDVAVVVATAYPAVETAVASLKAQASDYVKKPIDAPAFLSAVQAALARKGLSKDPEADLHRAIGQTIRDARKLQDLTLKQLARRTGLSVSLLSQIERAESSASISSLYKISSALKIRMAELFGDA
jgi:DNA-binding response OmpR family regulator